MTVTGTPLRAALPETSSRSGSVRSLIETPGDRGCVRAMPGAVDLVAVAVGEARPRPASCRRWPATSTSTAPTREVTVDQRAVGDAARGEVVRVHQQLVARLARGSAASVLCIHELLSRWWRRPISSSSPVGPGRRSVRPRAGRGRRATSGWARSIRLSVVWSRPGSVGPQRPEVDAVRVAAQRCAATARPAASQQQVDDAAGRADGQPGPLPAAASAAAASRVERAPVIRSARSRKISQSCRASSGPSRRPPA